MKNHFNTHPKGRINPYSFFCIIASSSPKSKQSSDMVSFPATFTLTFNNSFIELVLPVLVGMYIITARCLGLSEQFRINGREAHVFHSFHFFFFFLKLHPAIQWSLGREHRELFAKRQSGGFFSDLSFIFSFSKF